MRADGASAPEPLDAWHRQQGATWRDLDGRRVVDSYGDLPAELSALRGGCGFGERTWVEALELTGEDRHRFLNGFVTCDVGSLVAGTGTYGFFTDARGRILADATIHAGVDAIRVEVPAGRGERLAEHLAGFVIADRVEIAVAPPAGRWILVGSGVGEVARRWAPTVSESPWARAPAAVGRRRFELWPDRSLGVAAYCVSSGGGDVDLAEALTAQGARPVGFAALETLRTEAGVPRYGADFDAANFPQETCMEAAVDYEKGCYLGQEIVARIHYRGGVQRQLRTLVIEGSRPPLPGSSVTYEGREVGRVGSVAFSSLMDQHVGLSILHRRAAESGSKVTLPRGVTARVEAPGYAAAGLVARKESEA